MIVAKSRLSPRSQQDRSKPSCVGVIEVLKEVNPENAMTAFIADTSEAMRRAAASLLERRLAPRLT